MEQDIKWVRKFLKRNFHGPEVIEALRFRLKTHLTDPQLDPLSRQVWEGYKQLPDILETPCSILDAGCMSGFLYHFLKTKLTDFGYVGADIWEEALEVGREFAPVKFVKGNFFEDYFGEFDYVIISNISLPDKKWEIVINNMLPQARRKLILIHPESRIQLIERATGNIKDYRAKKADIPN